MVGGNEQRKGKDMERCRSREQIQAMKGKSEREREREGGIKDGDAIVAWVTDG